ncbi:SIS domain-containing protein [candidate division WOR-3 bacterium]|nr:SIS domain-containing protein [candidate division WOR-3 bacterium]
MSNDIDTFVNEHIQNYLNDLKETIDKLPVEKMEKLFSLLMDAYNNRNQIFVMGNGGSGATASHFMVDINKYTCYELDKKFRMICLNDNGPSISAYANDVCYEDVFMEQLKNFLKPGDLVIGISSSGNSENVLRAIDYANEIGAKTVGLVGFDGGKLKYVSRYSIVVPVYDMQKIEDLHLVISHITIQGLYKVLNKKLRWKNEQNLPCETRLHKI